MEKKSLIQEFKDFIMKGNVMDLAVGVVIGGAFSAIVTSLVNDVIGPVIGMICGGLDFSALALQVGDAPLMIGSFIQATINFLIVSLVIFSVVKAFNKARDLAAKKKEEEPAPEEPAGPTTEELLGQILEEIKTKK